MDPGLPQGFVHVDIPKTGDDSLIEKKRLNSRRPLLKKLV
jgi:hypothetical protein